MNEQEYAIIGYLITDPRLFVEIPPGFTSEMFGNKTAAVAFRIISDCIQTDTTPTPELLAGKLGTSVLQLKQYTDQISTDTPPVRELLDLVLDEYRSKNINQVCTDALENLLQSPPQDVIAETIDQLLAIDRVDEKAASGPLTPEIQEFFNDSRTASEEERPPGLAFGLREFDFFIQGLEKGDVTIICGCTSTGKTTYAQNLAWELLKQGRRIGLLSIEMNRRQLAGRFIAHHAGISYRTLRAGDLNPVEWQRYTHACQTATELMPNLFVSTYPGPEMKAFKMDMRRAISTGPLDLIVVDYLQLLVPFFSGKNATQKTTDASWALKTMAQSLDVPVIGISQLRRIASELPGLDDLRGSGAIENDASNVLALHDEGEEAALKTEIKILVLKNRNGPKGEYYVEFNKPTFTFTEVV